MRKRELSRGDGAAAGNQAGCWRRRGVVGLQPHLGSCYRQSQARLEGEAQQTSCQL